MTQDSSYHTVWGIYLLLAAFCVPCCVFFLTCVRLSRFCNGENERAAEEKFQQDLKDRKIKLTNSQKSFVFQNKASNSPVLAFLTFVGGFAKIVGLNILVLSGLQSDFYGAFKSWTIFYLVVMLGVPAMTIAGIVISTNMWNLDHFVQEKNEKIQTMKTEKAKRDKHDQSTDQSEDGGYADPFLEPSADALGLKSLLNQCRSLSSPMVASSVYQDFVTLPSVFLPVTAVQIMLLYFYTLTLLEVGEHESPLMGDKELAFYYCGACTV